MLIRLDLIQKENMLLLVCSEAVESNVHWIQTCKIGDQPYRTTILPPSNGECSLAVTCDAFTHTYPGFDIAVHGELEEKIWQIVGTAVRKIYGQP